MEPRAYRLKSDQCGNKAGTVVYKQKGYDYGLASDDTRNTGVEHITVTLKEDGGYPGFTVPVSDLEPIASVPSVQPAPASSTPSIDAMVDRFLARRIPLGFYPDCYISFDCEKASQHRSWPTGTNLLTAEQAREMLAHVVGGGEDEDSASTGLTGVSDAMAVVTKAMRADVGYYESWHANISVAAQDAGCPRDIAQAGATRFLDLLLRLPDSAPDQRPKTDAEPTGTVEKAKNKQLAELSTGSPVESKALMTTPIVGRGVWYWPNGIHAAGANALQPMAATIARVNNNRCVNLSIIDHSGRQFGASDVLLVHGDESYRPVTPYCEWMP